MHPHNKEVAMNHIGRDRASAVDAFAAIVVVLIVIAGVMAVLLYSQMTSPAHVSPDTVLVEEGDEVGFIYTGYLENTLVFETIDLDVAIDNTTYKKSLLFSWPEEGIFDPLTFVVGEGVLLDNFLGMANDGRVLEDALTGGQENETIVVGVTPETGFGDPDPSLVRTLSLTETIDQIEMMTFGDFGERFDSHVIVNSTIKDPLWGWDVRVSRIDEGAPERMVTIINLPDVGGIYTPYVGFQSEVVSVESGVNEGKG
jgi:FKBP-type peptidyl-prolyl cis-trans isomerase 2